MAATASGRSSARPKQAGTERRLVWAAVPASVGGAVCHGSRPQPAGCGRLLPAPRSAPRPGRTTCERTEGRAPARAASVLTARTGRSTVFLVRMRRCRIQCGAVSVWRAAGRDARGKPACPCPSSDPAGHTRRRCRLRTTHQRSNPGASSITAPETPRPRRPWPQFIRAAASPCRTIPSWLVALSGQQVHECTAGHFHSLLGQR
jgi:hypothetical protein